MNINPLLLKLAKRQSHLGSHLPEDLTPQLINQQLFYLGRLAIHNYEHI